MKTDNYLTLCLEQASKSSLRYRHGCIVVRGGKVIGQGYNDYRSGFNGGALKTGRLASGAADGAAIAELKRKQKQKQKQKPKSESESRDIQDTKPFTPFEGMGGGSHANTPLSMHSEMMAIHSALSSSSTMASSALSSQKPCFKLSGDSKRKARLRKDGLKAYVERVCLNALNQSATELRRGEAQVQEYCFEATASQPGQNGQGGFGQRERKRRGLVQQEKCGETPPEESEEWSTGESVSVRPFWTTETTATAVPT